jgi:hypothetical protein
MNAWDNLPNAKHIDWVLASVKANPDAWKTTHIVSWYAARTAARTAAQTAARTAARTAVWDMVLDTTHYAALRVSRNSAWGAVSALVAYDHCEKYLKMTPGELLIWWKLSEDPACLLLMPMVKVLDRNTHFCYNTD